MGGVIIKIYVFLYQNLNDKKITQDTKQKIEFMYFYIRI